MTPERLRELADHFRRECSAEGACAVCDEIHAYLIGTVKESLTDGKAPPEATGAHSLKLTWEFSDGVECKVELHGTERDLKMMAARMEYYRRLEEASAPHEPQGWQPIETAPHMRKIIVHYLNALGKSRTVMACYYEKNSLELHDDYEDAGTYDDATGMTWADEGWYEEHDSDNPIMTLAGVPTHWMSLPSAPSTKGSSHG